MKKPRAVLLALVATSSLVFACDTEDTTDKAKVPNVVGKNAAVAEDTLDDADLHAIFEDHPTYEEKCRVVSQDPPRGREVDVNTEINLECELDVPDVAGKKARAAESTLVGVGLEAKYVNRQGSLSLCRVKSQDKTGSVPPETTVALRLRCRRPPPSPPPEPEPEPEPEPQPEEANCHPSYDPCLKPDAGDYDCEGGSGDGPNYTGPVTVSGPDDFDLDRDGDGSACE